MAKRIPELKPGQRLTIRGSGSFKLPKRCDVDTLGVTEEVAREECACAKHTAQRNPPVKNLESLFRF